MSQTISAFSENIARIFRNILPGFLILIAANEAYPTWFDWIKWDNTSHLIVLVLVAIVAGNTWYVFHRYGVHQFIDHAFYLFSKEGPALKSDTGKDSDNEKESNRNFLKRSCKILQGVLISLRMKFLNPRHGTYVDDLAKHVVKTLRTVPQNDPVRQHVELRASGMHLMYIASEVSVLFALFHESTSFFAENRSLMLIGGAVGFILTILQNTITRRIDWYSVELIDLYPVGKQLERKADTDQD